MRGVIDEALRVQTWYAFGGSRRERIKVDVCVSMISGEFGDGPVASRPMAATKQNTEDRLHTNDPTAQCAELGTGQCCLFPCTMSCTQDKIVISVPVLRVVSFAIPIGWHR